MMGVLNWNDKEIKHLEKEYRVAVGVFTAIVFLLIFVGSFG